ncbi:VOC family protein [Algibacter sp. PT7-4]|uniref:VOC family protein n=1 Tax=Algibacter ulvanivorans TaxID=3400999 RepID=UPI003AAC3DA7
MFKRKIERCFVVLILMFGLLSCKNDSIKKNSNKVTGNVTSNLQVDHLNIWVKNPKKAKKALTDVGFTCVPDSLSQIHNGQGTAGKYFHFLNGYLELIFVNNKNELEENCKKNKELDFVERANFNNNEASPYSIALKVKDYNIDKIPFKKVAYHQNWMADKMNIYSAKNSKIQLKEPSIFVVYPEIESETFKTLAHLKNIPEKYAFARTFYKHPNDAKKITKIVITSYGLNLKSETIKAVNKIENVTVKNGSEHIMELFFDENEQEITIDLRPELPLIVYL